MRASYRMESVAVALLALLIVLALPLAIGVGTLTYRDTVRRTAQLTSSTSRADAVLDSVPATTSFTMYGFVEAPAHWAFAGERHVGVVEAPVNSHVGDQVSILVNADGEQAPVLPRHFAGTANGVGAGAGVFAVAVLLALAGRWCLRAALDRERRRAWADEWALLAGTRRWNRL